MNDKAPPLLICQDLLDVIDSQSVELNSLGLLFQTKDFLYAYTLLEGAIWRVCSKIMLAFPEKLVGEGIKNEDFFIPKKLILQTYDYYNILNNIVEDKLFKQSKANMKSYLKYLIKTLEYDVSFDESIVDLMNTARNSIAHNNAPDYIDMKITDTSDCKLQYQDVKLYIEHINVILLNMKKAITAKYSKYTHKKLILDSWSFTMPCWIGVQNVFNFSRKTAVINFEETKKIAKSICTGEKFMLLMWLENYNSDVAFRIMEGSGCIGSHAFHLNSNKVNFLQRMFKLFPFMVNGREINFEVETNGYIENTEKEFNIQSNKLDEKTIK